MIAGGSAVFIGCVAHAVLGSQFLRNAGVNLADGFLLSHFKETSAGFFGNPLKNLLAVGARFFRMTLAAAAAATRITTSATRPAAASAGVTAATPSHSTALPVTVFVVRLREIDGVDNGVGTLSGLDRALQVGLAAAVDAVRKNDECFPALLLFHQFVRRQKYRVVKLGTAAVMRSRTRAGIVIVGVVRAL